MNSKLLKVSMIALALTLTACGRETKIYRANDSGSASLNDLPITIIDRPYLPSGFYDQSVNRASAMLALDGVTPTSVAIKLQTSADINVEGSFNGNGTGNRSLLGDSRQSGKKLSALSKIEFDAKTVTGSGEVSILLITDLKCDGTEIRLLTADSSALSASAVPQNHGYVRQAADTAESAWKVSGTAIIDPNDSNITLVASDAGAATSSLTALMTAYPDACLRNSASGDQALPKNIPTASVIFALGDSQTAQANVVFINRIAIGSDVVVPEATP